MKSNEDTGFIAIHEGEFSGDAGSDYSANVIVGRRGDEYRAECYVFFHDQDASRRGVRDRIAARGGNPGSALDALLAVEHGWDEEWTTGLRRAAAEAREDLADYAA